MIGQKFATPKLDYWCSPPTNSTFEMWNASKWRSFSSPNIKIGNKKGDLIDRCHIYDVSYDSELSSAIDGIVISSTYNLYSFIYSKSNHWNISYWMFLLSQNI